VVDIQETHTAVVAEITRLLAEEGKPVPSIGLDDGLIDLGLDSLSFAVVITRLEELLGYEPLDLIESGEFPRTVRELVAVYTRGCAENA
jgi:acyl carrier protein